MAWGQTCTWSTEKIILLQGRFIPVHKTWYKLKKTFNTEALAVQLEPACIRRI